MPSQISRPAITLNSTTFLLLPLPPTPITPEYLAEMLTLTTHSLSSLHRTLTSLTSLLNATHHQHISTLHDARSYHIYLTNQILALRRHAEDLMTLNMDEHFWEWVGLRNLLHAISDGPGARCVELVRRMEEMYAEWVDRVWRWIKWGWEDFVRGQDLVEWVFDRAGRRGWWFRLHDEVYYFLGEGGEGKVLRGQASAA
ncbi:hypothetical protein L873DRAFT_1787782 [Choiromyces venosus 120613-1]|uniref:Uncharacterized protein n=1 Tax=Choiromyces venosus 120613-1 TaxID=1336337 RepID=A0A3N4K8Z2_9PEZI|nr:hypothetical protein L873DRAFT_1787782 [Choiromyces venosus 120613-1]